MILEACVNSALSAILAEKGGAGRVELCENMAEGGCTPSAGTIRYAVSHLTIPVFVMIRPRGADFCYSAEEFEIMKEDVAQAKELGAAGVVFGILRTDGTIDSGRMAELVRMARPLGVTCHRAFDMTRDPFEALEALISLGIDRVLTSGQSDSALIGAPLIKELIRRSSGRIRIMPGHGIKEHNLARVIEATGATEYHLYLTQQVRTSMEFERDGVRMGRPEQPEYEITRVDPERIRKAQAIMLTYKTTEP